MASPSPDKSKMLCLPTPATKQIGRETEKDRNYQIGLLIDLAFDGSADGTIPPTEKPAHMIRPGPTEIEYWSIPPPPTEKEAGTLLPTPAYKEAGIFPPSPKENESFAIPRTSTK